MTAQPDDREPPTAFVHLVRHGQSTWNVERRLQGQTAHPQLTEQGRDDAHRAADLLAAKIDPAHDRITIYSSDLVRARQTADIIAAALACSVTPTRALREQHVGTMEGQLTSDLRPEPVPEGVDISEVRWGGGESIADVYRRLHEFFSTEVDRSAFADGQGETTRHVVLVTHGDTLRVARALLAGRSHRDVDWEVVANGAVITLDYHRVGPC